MYIPRTFDGNPGGGGCASDVDVVVVILEVVFSVVRSFCVDVVSESVVVNVNICFSTPPSYDGRGATYDG